jgi:hypothetical protein
MRISGVQVQNLQIEAPFYKEILAICSATGCFKPCTRDVAFFKITEKVFFT